MRTSLLLASLVAAAALVALLVSRRDGGSSVKADERGAVTLVGDSLNVGIEPYLQDDLARWTIHSDDEVGRPTWAGLDVLRAAGRSLAPRVVLSLGTNDAASDVDTFRHNVRMALTIVGPGRCVIWVNIARDGDAYQGFNDVLDRESQRVPNLRVVDWASMVKAHPEWLSADGVHANATGYEKRAAAVADTVRACRPTQELKPAP